MDTVELLLFLLVIVVQIDTVVAAYHGTSCSALTCIGVSDDTSSCLLSNRYTIYSFSVSSSYVNAYVAIGGYNGLTGTYSVTFQF